MNKFLLYAGGVLCLLAGGIYVWKKSKSFNVEEEDKPVETKSLQVINVEQPPILTEEEEDNETPEEVKKEELDIKEVYVGDEYQNLVRSMYASVRFGSEYDIDLINLDRVFSTSDNKINHNYPKGILHVNLSDHGEGVQYLTFFMEIPKNVDNREVGNFISTFKRAENHIKKEILPYCNEEILSSLTGRLILRKDIEENGKIETIYNIRRIEKSLYYDNDRYKNIDKRTGKRLDGIVNYVKMNCADLEAGIKLDPIKDNQLEGEIFDIEDLILGYIIEIPITTKENPGGVSLSTGLKCLNYLINNDPSVDDEDLVKIRYKQIINLDGLNRNMRYTTVEYDTVLFHNPFTFRDEIYDAPLVPDKLTGKCEISLVQVQWGK